MRVAQFEYFKEQKVVLMMVTMILIAGQRFLSLIFVAGFYMNDRFLWSYVTVEETVLMTINKVQENIVKFMYD